MPWSQAGNIRGPQGPQGAQGPEGPQGPAGPAGPAGLTWRGAWSNSNSYAINDAVAWGGSTYFATTAKTPSSPPPTGTAGDAGGDDAAVNAGWAVLSLQGTQGPQGSQGIQGPQGDPGPQGNPGSPGTRGSQWYTGTGAPGTISGAIAGDKYLDVSNGDVYTLS